LKNENEISTIHCPICEGSLEQTGLVVKDYTVSGELFNLLECATCTLRITENAPDEAHIGKYYQADTYISHSNTTKSFLGLIYKAVRSRTLKKKATIIKEFTKKQTGALLDIGSGVGSFAASMQTAGWQVQAIEPDAGARAKAKELYNLNAEPLSLLESIEAESLDAITMWHVLEHVHKLHQTMANIKRALAPQGCIFIAVPNYTSGDAAYFQQFWAGYDVPRHLYHFSPQSMEILAAKHGLEIVKLLPMWYDSYYVSLLSTKYKFGKMNYLKAFIQGLASNRRAKLDVRFCSSIIYVMRKK